MIFFNLLFYISLSTGQPSPPGAPYWGGNCEWCPDARPICEGSVEFLRIFFSCTLEDFEGSFVKAGVLRLLLLSFPGATAGETVSTSSPTIVLMMN